MVPCPERMDYLDYTPMCGVKDAEIFSRFRFGSGKIPNARGELSQELLDNYIQGRWFDPGL